MARARLRMVVATIAIALCGIALILPNAAQAQSQLPPRITTLQSEIQTPLKGVEAKTFATDEARDTAFAQAISTVMQSLIRGGAPAALSTSLVIETAISQGQNCDPTSSAGRSRVNCVSARAIGIGLADAAAQFANSPAIVSAIAQTIANEGLLGMGQAFADAFTAAGGSKALASIATSAPNVVATFGFGFGSSSGSIFGNSKSFSPFIIKNVIVTAIAKLKSLITGVICHFRPSCS